MKIFCCAEIDEVETLSRAPRTTPPSLCKNLATESAIQEIKLDRKFDDKNVANFIDSE
jgi:hypothetical protein